MEQQIKDCLAWIKPRLKEFNSDLICRVFAQIEINLANTSYDSAIKQLQRLLGLLPSESEEFAVVRALILRLNGTYVIPQEEGAPPPPPPLLRQSPNPKTDKETQTFPLSEVERIASAVELVELGSQTTEEFSLAETFYRVFGGKNRPHLSHSNFAPLQALDSTSDIYPDTSLVPADKVLILSKDTFTNSDCPKESEENQHQHLILLDTKLQESPAKAKKDSGLKDLMLSDNYQPYVSELLSPKAQESLKLAQNYIRSLLDGILTDATLASWLKTSRGGVSLATLSEKANPLLSIEPPSSRPNEETQTSTQSQEEASTTNAIELAKEEDSQATEELSSAEIVNTTYQSDYSHSCLINDTSTPQTQSPASDTYPDSSAASKLREFLAALGKCEKVSDELMAKLLESIAKDIKNIEKRIMQLFPSIAENPLLSDISQPSVPGFVSLQVRVNRKLGPVTASFSLSYVISQGGKPIRMRETSQDKVELGDAQTRRGWAGNEGGLRRTCLLSGGEITYAFLGSQVIWVERRSFRWIRVY